MEEKELGIREWRGRFPMQGRLTEEGDADGRIAGRGLCRSWRRSPLCVEGNMKCRRKANSRSKKMDRLFSINA